MTHSPWQSPVLFILFLTSPCRDGGAKMLYKVIGGTSDVVTVEEGALISGSNSGQAALHITAVEESGVSQTLVIMVKVCRFLFV